MKRTILKTFTVLWLLGMYVVLMFTFMTAYASPQKAVRVAIDQYSEAQFEFYMLIASLGLSLIGTIYIITDIKNDFLKGESVRLLARDSD
jgi:hypothetical protein